MSAQKELMLRRLGDAIMGRGVPGEQARRMVSQDPQKYHADYAEIKRRGSSEFDGPPSLSEVADEVRRQAELLKSGRLSPEQVADAMTKMADALKNIDENGYPPSRDGAPNPSR